MCIRDRAKNGTATYDLAVTVNEASGAGTFNIVGDTPVSYTHLDVYKRQSQGGAHGDFTSVSDPDTGIISSSSSYLSLIHI